MASSRRSAIDLVTGKGEESPLAAKMRAQKEAAAAARASEEKGANGLATSPASSEPEVPETSPASAKVQPPVRATEGRVATTRQNAPRRASAGFADAKTVKRVQVSREEAGHWITACKAISEQVGAEVTYSAVCRTVMAMLVDAQDTLDQVPAPQLRRPANGDTLGFADFEEQLGDYLRAVLQRRGRR